MQFTAFEQAILEWYLTKYADEGLSAQIRAAVPTKRDYTGAGLFIDLEVRVDAPAISSELPKLIDGPYLKSPQIEHGGGAVLVQEGGRLAYLELFAYGNNFSENITEFDLLDEGPD